MALKVSWSGHALVDEDSEADKLIGFFFLVVGARLLFSYLLLLLLNSNRDLNYIYWSSSEADEIK